MQLLTSPFQDEDQQEGGPGESVSRLVGICRSLSYHMPAEGGQAAILVDSTKFLKNREGFLHSSDFWWVNSTTQELLKKKDCEKQRLVAID